MADLITLDRAKAQIPAAPDSDDTLIAALISACSAVIETDTHRAFTQATYDERLDGTGTPYLYVDNPPIQQVIAVRTNQLPAIYILLTDNTNTVQAATVDVTSSAVVLSYTYAASTTQTTFSFASYPTFGSLTTAINAISQPAVGVWSAILNPQFGEWATADLTSDLGSYSARNLTVALQVYWWTLPYYRYASQRGEIFSPSGFLPGYENYRVQYVGGFADIPDEIQQACAELVQLTYATVRANPLMNSETLDKYTYTKTATSSYNNLSITSKKAIQQYKIYRVGRFK